MRFAGLAILLTVQFAAAQDKKGCQDSPLITRFPGSVISDCKDSPDGTFEFSMPGAGSKKVEGEYHYLEYRSPSTATNAQLARNLGTALRTAGYTIAYENQSHDKFVGHMGQTWIQLEVSSNGQVWEHTVKEIALTQDIVASAAEMSSGLTNSGHSVVNGILFDTGKADIKPESAPALEEVVKLLKQNAAMKVYVVGHTDNVGALAGNLDLSKRRAAAVVQMLVTKYGVAAARLQSFGNGPYAPLASNDNEAGRTLNRRVELVKQ
jgi:outer membrane protein OmpA-like peptidoglycan-associated protein